MPSFDHAAGDPVLGAIVIEPRHTIVLVEGNYVLLGAVLLAMEHYNPDIHHVHRGAAMGFTATAL